MSVGYALLFHTGRQTNTFVADTKVRASGEGYVSRPEIDLVRHNWSGIPGPRGGAGDGADMRILEAAQITTS